MKKAIFKTAIIVSALTVFSSVSCITASAAADTTIPTITGTVPANASVSETITEDERNETASIPSGRNTTTVAPALTTTAEVTTAENSTLPEQNNEADEEITLANPYLTGMLSDDELYNYIINSYLDDGAALDLSGSGVLVDESVVNPSYDETDTDTEVNKNVQTSTSDEKLMYTVVTRDGSTFYIIVDKSSGGENVYFLNSVDLVDLASLINASVSDSEDLSAAEKKIVSDAGETVKQDEAVVNENDSKIDEQVPSDEVTEVVGSKEKASNYIIYIVFGVFAVVFLGFMAYKKIGPGKKSNVSFNEDDDDEYEEATVEDTETEETTENLEDGYDE